MLLSHVAPLMLTNDDLSSLCSPILPCPTCIWWPMPTVNGCHSLEHTVKTFPIFFCLPQLACPPWLPCLLPPVTQTSHLTSLLPLTHPYRPHLSPCLPPLACPPKNKKAQHVGFLPSSAALGTSFTPPPTRSHSNTLYSHRRTTNLRREGVA